MTALPEAAQPLIIIGAGRSGTNMLRDSLTRLPGVVTWPCDEINYIWRHGNRAWPTDELPVRLATSSVSAYVNRRFDDIAQSQGLSADSPRRIVVEKTCANSLRVPFVDAVMPKARYLHIVRDGRDVVASAQKRWKAPLDLAYLAAKARYVPISDLPYYASRYAVNRFAKLRSREAAVSVWGPRFEGMQEIADTQGLDALCAAQWARCVDLSDAAFAAMPSARVHVVYYERFVDDPRAHLQAIAEFLGTSLSDTELDLATTGIKANSVGKGGREQVPDVLANMKSTLERHGYL